jgi:intracellular sulfur oxidation DsrE/DsrF family protein
MAFHISSPCVVFIKITRKRERWIVIIIHRYLLYSQTLPARRANIHLNIRITMKYLLTVLLLTIFITAAGAAQISLSPDSAKVRKDSVMAAKKFADSLRFAKLLSIAQYPVIKGGKFSGVIPVENPTEVPDPNRDYKLLFDLTEKNPDSLAKNINSGLDEVARVLNLHVASGISPKRLTPVIIFHGKGLEALMTNERYKKKHAIDNPNIQIIHDLENVGAKFIACGQAMAFFDLKKEDLLPEIKITLTAQTVFSNYQLQGYVPYRVREND